MANFARVLIIFAPMCLISVYFSAVYYVWPCRQSPLGRELQEAKSTMLRPRDHAEAPCADSSASSIFMEMTHSGSFIAEAQQHNHDVNSDSKKTVSAPKEAEAVGEAVGEAVEEAFVNPWSAEAWQAAIDKGALLSANLNQCVIDHWENMNAGDTLQDDEIMAYHKQERILAVQNVIQDPTAGDNTVVCPKSATVHAQLNALADGKLNELDAKIAEVAALVGGNGGTSKAATHFADVENAMRAANSQPLLSMDAQYIKDNWIPITEKLAEDLQNQHQISVSAQKLSLPAVHTYLTIYQVEQIRASLGASTTLAP